MKTFNLFWLFILSVLIATACSPTVTPIPAITPIPPVKSNSAMTPIPVMTPNTTLSPSPPEIQGDNPYATQPEDAGMMRGDVRIDSASLNVAESNPPKVTLNFAYFQPTPCFMLRVEVNQPDTQNRIQVGAYAVTEKDKACALMALATPLEASVYLGSFPKGHFSVWVNGVMAGEFDS